MHGMIRPTRSSVIFAVLVGAVSVFLVAIGAGRLLAPEPDTVMGLAAAGLGGYGLFNVLQTPTSLRAAGGMVELRGLLPRRAQARDLDRVVLERGGIRRPWVWRFKLRDGGLAFETDAGLWNQGELRALLKSAGVRVEPSR
jgi:hypothetical protein